MRIIHALSGKGMILRKRIPRIVLCHRITIFVSTLKDSFVLDVEDDYWILHVRNNLEFWKKNVLVKLCGKEIYVPWGHNIYLPDRMGRCTYIWRHKKAYVHVIIYVGFYVDTRYVKIPKYRPDTRHHNQGKEYKYDQVWRDGPFECWEFEDFILFYRDSMM